MKNIVYNAVLAAMVAATTLLNTVNAAAAPTADTVSSDSTKVATASPEVVDYGVEEAALPVEAWMMESIDILNEEKIAVEDWMMEDVNLLNEESLDVEDWMDEDVDLLNEEALELEDWMFAANADSTQSKN